MPGKALKDIHGLPLVIRVAEACRETDLPVFIKTPDKEIMDVAHEYKHKTIWSRERGCFNGTDAVAEAAATLPYNVIVNVQGDLPGITPKIISDALAALEGADLSTPISGADGNVTCTIDNRIITGYHRKKGRFSHVGIYCYHTLSLLRYRIMERSKKEIKTDLEGWRAIEGGLVTRWSWCEDPPHAVDTEEDLEHVRNSWPLRH